VTRPSPAAPRLRRVPVQARSRRRFDAILDAAAALFGERGFDAASMEAIAASAGTSIGSVYQFFPDKLAVFEALAHRCLDRSRVLLDGMLSAGAARDWPELLDTIVEGCNHMRTSDPGFRALWSNLQLYGLYSEADLAMHRELVRRIEDLAILYGSPLGAAERRTVATTVVYVVSAMLFFMAQESEGDAARLLGETKILLRRYLAPYLPHRDRARRAPRARASARRARPPAGRAKKARRGRARRQER
jgi:AcrR family transcriptional regulator